MIQKILSGKNNINVEPVCLVWLGFLFDITRTLELKSGRPNNNLIKKLSKEQFGVACSVEGQFVNVGDDVIDCFKIVQKNSPFECKAVFNKAFMRAVRKQKRG